MPLSKFTSSKKARQAHHAFGALLNMDAVDGNIQLQQILLKIFVIVPSMLNQYCGLFKRHVFSDAVDQGTKAFARLLKGKSWTSLETLMPLEQSS
jgi:hypothetical protein